MNFPSSGNEFEISRVISRGSGTRQSLLPGSHPTTKPLPLHLPGDVSSHSSKSSRNNTSSRNRSKNSSDTDTNNNTSSSSNNISINRSNNSSNTAILG